MNITIVGHDHVVEEVARSQAPIVLLTGDSGIGKSTVLIRAQEATESALTGGIRTIRHTESSTQAILTALSGPAAHLAERAGPKEFARQMVDAARRLGIKYQNELPRLVISFFVGTVLSRAAPMLRRVLSDFLKEIQAGSARGLEAEITSRVDPLTSEVVSDLVAKLLELTETDSRVVLSIDAVERLPRQDLRIFADLAETLPNRAQIRLAHRTSTSEEFDRVEWLLGTHEGIQEIEIRALSEDNAGDWLEGVGLSRDLATEVLKRSGGYPLHLGDLIAHLIAGGRVDDAPLHESFVRATGTTWRRLPDNWRRAAGRLAVLSDPLDRDALARFLDLSEDEWFSLVESLERARIFSVNVNGVPWFHEERRHAVLQAIDPVERTTNHERAAEFLFELIQTGNRAELLGELSLQVENSPMLLEGDPRLRAVINLGQTECSVLGSVLELAEPSKRFTVIGDTVLRHWRNRWKTDGDSLAALNSLANKEVVLIVTRENASVVALLGNSLSIAVAVGLIVRKLGRMPIRAISSFFFETVLRQRLGRFEIGAHGDGAPTAAYLSTRIGEGIRDTEALCGLYAISEFAGISFYLTATYADSARRDEALEALRGFEVNILDARFSVVEVVAYPLGRVPSERFLAAAELAIGRPVFGFLSVQYKLSIAMQVVEWMNLRLDTVRQVRELCSENERRATGTDRSFSLYWEEGENGYREVQALGGREEAVPLRELMDPRRGDVWKVWGNPFAMVQLEEALGLGPEGSIRRLSVGGTLQTDVDPVLYELGQLREHARRFNNSQPKRRVVLEPENLRDLLERSIQARLDLARELADRLPLGGEQCLRYPPTLTCILVVLELPSTGWVPGARSALHLRSFTRKYQSDEFRFHHLVVEAPSGDWYGIVDTPSEFTFDTVFGVDWENADRSLSGDFHTLLADLLGYQVTDLAFEWPRPPRAQTFNGN